MKKLTSANRKAWMSGSYQSDAQPKLPDYSTRRYNKNPHRRES